MPLVAPGRSTLAPPQDKRSSPWRGLFLHWSFSRPRSSPRWCSATRVLYGQDGNDRLGGSVYSDRIIGGPGTDMTDAGGGFDTCRTVEVIRSNGCESK
jgi:hypothetical protein